MRVLATGATGYIGGRLVPRLLRRGHHVRLLVRDPDRVSGRMWADQVEVVRGDLLDSDSLQGAFDGIDVAYYLVHSMLSGKDFDQRDRQAAENFCHAASPSLKHVVYLGGLMPLGRRISKHLLSRAEIGRILASHFPITELRAGPIIGSGSASFEMLRYLTERVPLIIAPNWVKNDIHPIAVRDVLSYLLAAIEMRPGGTVEIGANRMTYKQLIKTYARARGLRRMVLSLPHLLLPTGIGATWTALTTPIPRALALPLLKSMAYPLYAETSRARRLFPKITPITSQKAVKLALGRILEQAVETRWSGALGAERKTYLYQNQRGLVREVRTLFVPATPDQVFRAFTGIGGDRGWLTWNWAWWLRGWADRLLGGPGLRRGRRHPDELLPGETVDFWRVEVIRPPNLLRLRAEAKLPGHAWLQWEASDEGEGTRLTQTAAFDPHGLPGALYWNMLYPFHRLIFTDMIEAIGKRATAD